MKKLLLLSGVAFLAVANVNTASAGMNYRSSSEYAPYIGVDYVYSHAKMGGSARNFKDDFHSAKFDLGMQMYKNWYMEFSYQMSGKVKNRGGYEDNTVKTSFMDYAMDMYGKYPIMCSDFSLLATVGAAIYDLDFKGMNNKSTTRVGYRGGLGMQYDFNQDWAARAVARYSYVGANRMNNLKEATVGMIYRF